MNNEKTTRGAEHGRVLMINDYQVPVLSEKNETTNKYNQGLLEYNGLRSTATVMDSLNLFFEVADSSRRSLTLFPSSIHSFAMTCKIVALVFFFVADAFQQKSAILGGITPLVMPGQDGFVAAMSVPTFACTLSDLQSSPKLKDNLESKLNQGPAITLSSVLSKALCDNLIDEFEALGFGSFEAGKNHHGALQILVPEHTCNIIGDALRPFVDCSQVEACHREMVSQTTGSEPRSSSERFSMVGINRRWRVYRYAAGSNERFSPHIDSAFPPSDHNGQELIWDASRGTVVSRLTLLMYLNDDFVGGETNFFGRDEELIASVRPEAGSCLMFPQAVGEDALDYARLHWPLHEGSPVLSGKRPKYVIRSDVLFTQRHE